MSNDQNSTVGLTSAQALGINNYRDVLEVGLLHYGIPQHMRAAIVVYVMAGHPLPNFLFYLFSNDLKETVVHADDLNRDRLRDYVNFIVGVVPVHCWGAEAKVNNWYRIGGVIGRELHRHTLVGLGPDAAVEPAHPHPLSDEAEAESRANLAHPGRPHDTTPHDASI